MNFLLNKLIDNIGFFPATLLIAIVFYVILIIADIIKRGLLSRLFLWSGFMIIAPVHFAHCLLGTAVMLLGRSGEFLAGLYSENFEFTSVGRTIATVLLSLVFTLILAVLYIRGHIKPLDKRSHKFEFCGKEQLIYYSSRRLIVTGLIGLALYLPVFLILLFDFIILDPLFYLGSALFVQDPRLIFCVPIAILIILMMPLINLMFIGVALVYLLCRGIFAAALSVAGFAVFVEWLLVINGCIRLIVNTDYSKKMKALLIILSFIPTFGIIYGIYLLKKRSERIKII